jgi:oxygen-independent coproporphyrinogen-3 oxidase
LLLPDAEITTEANPGTVTVDQLRCLHQAGFNRISLGAQSFRQEELGLLGRIHSVDEICTAVEAARQAGFDNLNLDLINDLPGQSVASWLYTLDQALKLQPKHLSVYGLAIEEGTPLAGDLNAGRITPCSEDVQVALWEATEATLASAGFDRYEISNYARPGNECRHNLAYWLNTPYLGVGAGACGFIDHTRYANLSDIPSYITAVTKGHLPRDTEERQSMELERTETVITGLRLARGIDRQRFQQRFGAPFEEFYHQELGLLVPEGLLLFDADSVRLTSRGMLLANQVLQYFV